MERRLLGALLSASLWLLPSPARRPGVHRMRPVLPCTSAARRVVDRLEGTLAVVVGPGARQAQAVPRALLPAGVREGDVLVAGRLRPDCRRMLHGQVVERRSLLQPGTDGGTRALTRGGEN